MIWTDGLEQPSAQALRSDSVCILVETVPSQLVWIVIHFARGTHDGEALQYACAVREELLYLSKSLARWLAKGKQTNVHHRRILSFGCLMKAWATGKAINPSLNLRYD